MPDVLEDKPRAYPIEIGHPGKWHDSVDIVLPPGHVVDQTPNPVDVDLDFATYDSTVTAKENKLHYEREYVVRKVKIPAKKAARVPQAPKRQRRRPKRNCRSQKRVARPRHPAP